MVPASSRSRSAINFFKRLISSVMWVGIRKRFRWLARLMLVACYTCTRPGTIVDASFVQREGRSYIDLEQGTFLRLSTDEFRPNWYGDPPPILVPRPLLEHMRRWRVQGAQGPVERLCSPAGLARAFRRVASEVLDPERARQANLHLFRSTGEEWLKAGGVSKDVRDLFLHRRPEMTKSLYWGVRPHQEQVHYAAARSKRS